MDITILFYASIFGLVCYLVFRKKQKEKERLKDIIKQAIQESKKNND